MSILTKYYYYYYYYYYIFIVTNICLNGIVAGRGQSGIWYSTWYAAKGNYIWGQGIGSGGRNSFVGDVNGDLKADAVAFIDNGTWLVGISDGSLFSTGTSWIEGHGYGSDNQFLADVNGDNRDDAIVYFDTMNGGSWYVALSSGSGFESASVWMSSFGAGNTNHLLSDVNGDLLADIIVFNENNGQWWVALSNGREFVNPAVWITGHGVGSDSRLMGDVNGDGKQDAIAFFASSGSWYVSLSSGSSFLDYSEWISGAGGEPLVGDVNGDGLGDAIFYQNNNWNVAFSSGSNSFINPQVWKESHGGDIQMVGNVFGDNTTSAVQFNTADGSWRVLPADMSIILPDNWNTWQAWGLAAVPYVYSEKAYRQYDSGEIVIIDEHLSLIESAQIDFLILDETNNLMVDNGYIFDRAIILCERLYNLTLENKTNIKYAIAIGGYQFSTNPQTVEDEAELVWNNFINNPKCGGLSTYFNFDNNPPLLVEYVANYAQRQAWESWTGDKTYANKFQMLWCQGVLPDSSNLPPASQYGEYVGWGIPKGSLPNSDLMIVMPGWDNHKGMYVDRAQGAFYTQDGWDLVMQSLPQAVVINSFNEYAELTATAAADTSRLPSNDQWSDPFMYWTLTQQNNQAYKSKINTFS